MMITRSSASKLRNRNSLYNIPSSMPCFKSSSTFTTNTKSMDDNVGTIHNNDPENNNNNSNNPKVLPSLLESLEDDDRMVAEGKTNSGSIGSGSGSVSNNRRYKNESNQQHTREQHRREQHIRQRQRQQIHERSKFLSGDCWAFG